MAAPQHSPEQPNDNDEKDGGASPKKQVPNAVNRAGAATLGSERGLDAATSRKQQGAEHASAREDRSSRHPVFGDNRVHSARLWHFYPEANIASDKWVPGNGVVRFIIAVSPASAQLRPFRTAAAASRFRGASGASLLSHLRFTPGPFTLVARLERASAPRSCERFEA